MRKKILIACEFSGTIRTAFEKIGWDATSCDLLDTEQPGKHIKGDVLSLASYDYDLLVGNPPCTDLSNAGANLWKIKAENGLQQEGFNFVKELCFLPIKFKAIENPAGWLNTHWIKPDQIIHPYYFCEPGDLEYVMKRTCIWLEGLPTLIHPTNKPKPEPMAYFKTGPKAGKPIHFTANANGWKKRSKTFECIAQAMALQWNAFYELNHDKPIQNFLVI